MQARLNFILSTIGDNHLYILDEPSTSLDIISKRQVWNIIEELKKDAIVLLTTHDMDEAEFLADQVVLLAKGTMKQSGSIVELQKKNQHLSRLKLVIPCSKGTFFKMNYVKMWLLSLIGKARVLNETEQSITLQVQFENQEHFEKVLEVISKEKIFEWAFKSISIEDIYLSMDSQEEDLRIDHVDSISFHDFVEMKSLGLESEEEQVPSLTEKSFTWKHAGTIHQFHCQRSRLIALVKSNHYFLLGYVYIIVSYTLASVVLWAMDFSNTDIGPGKFGLARTIGFFLLIPSIRVASLVADDHISGAFQLICSQSGSKKAYWYAITFCGFLFSSLICVASVPMMYFFGFFYLAYWIVPIILVSAFCSTAIGILVFVILGQHYNPVVVLIVLYITCLVTPSGSWGFGFIPGWGVVHSLGNDATGLSILGVLISSTVMLGISLYLCNHTEKSNRYVLDSSNTQVMMNSDSNKTSADTSIVVQNISKVYGDQVILDHVDMEFKTGHMTGIIGPNGAGKTTLLKILYDNSMMFDGNVHFYTSTLGQGSLLGVCSQQNVFWPAFTVRDHFKFFATLMGLEETQIPRWISYVSKLVLINEKMLQKYPLELSGGMLRKLSIGIALSVNASILLLDEPSAGVDILARKYIWNSLRSIQMNGLKTILFTTHSINEVSELCEEVLMLVNGKVKGQGSIPELKAQHTANYKVQVSYYSDVLEDGDIESVLASYQVTPIISVRHMGALQVTDVMFPWNAEIKVLLQIVHSLKQLGLCSYSIQNSSLEDVFFKLGTESTQSQ
jgi:ABC-type multidrug transport system ATPase subunit